MYLIKEVLNNGMQQEVSQFFCVRFGNMCLYLLHFPLRRRKTNVNPAKMTTMKYFVNTMKCFISVYECWKLAVRCSF